MTQASAMILGHRGVHEPRAGQRAGRWTRAADIWAFGAVLYEMLSLGV